jgi:hypothetical protein
MSELSRQELVEREQRGDFTLSDLNPGAEYPLLLTRAPLFPPTKRSVVRRMRDDELSLPFSTGWCEGRLFGPPLNTYDEDTMIALAGLRQQMLEGSPDKMPIRTKSVIPFDRPTRVHCLYLTVTDIQRFLGQAIGGSGHKRRLESVHRLGATRVELNKISDKSVGKNFVQTVTISLIDVATVDEGKESYLYVQFPPEMAMWLEESYAYLDISIRNQLTDNGKAIHRFLSGQSTFNISTEKLRENTGSQLTKKRFMQELRKTMAQLADLGWCEYVIEGNGRSKPHKLVGKRLRRR